MIGLLRRVAATAMIGVVGLFGLAAVFSDKRPDESMAIRALFVAVVYVGGCGVIGMLWPKRWPMAVVAASGPIVFGLLGLAAKVIHDAPVSSATLIRCLVVFPGMALAGGRLGRWVADRREPPPVEVVVKEPVWISTYDPGWPDSFEREKAYLKSRFPGYLIRRLEHFGSTAVPGLAAKPIIDMLVEVGSLDTVRRRIAPILTAEGYEYFWRPTHGDDGPPWYAWFIKRDPRSGLRTHHIHMVEPAFKEHWDRLLFRDYLIGHPDVAKEYETLKRRLCETTGDRIAYTRGKSEFIAKVTAQARQG